MNLHTVCSLCPHWWQMTSLTETKLNRFSPQKIKRKMMSLLTDNMWRMRTAKHSILIIQYKLLTLLFQQALFSPIPTLYCPACICLKSWLGNGASDPSETFSIHLCLLHSWFNIQHNHSSALLCWCLQRQDAEKCGREKNTTAGSRGCGAWSPVSRCICQKLVESDQAVHLNPHRGPKNFRGITLWLCFFI